MTRDTSTPERAAFWENVKRSAAEARELPAWALAGVDLNPEVYETYPPKGGE